jgi:hypothetical protein
MPECASSQELRDFEKIWHGLVVIFEHVLFGQSQIEQQVDHDIEILLEERTLSIRVEHVVVEIER